MGVVILDQPSSSDSHNQILEIKPKMASLMRRCVFSQFRRIHTGVPCLEKESKKGWKVMDYEDHIMGKERAIYEAQKAGITDPYFLEPIELNTNSTKDNPNIVYSVNYTRSVQCICDPDENHLVHMKLYAGPATRCRCGHWFKLQLVEPLFEP